MAIVAPVLSQLITRYPNEWLGWTHTSHTPASSSLILTQIPIFYLRRSTSSTSISQHHHIATHCRLLLAATSYDGAMPAAVALLCRGRSGKPCYNRLVYMLQPPTAVLHSNDRSETRLPACRATIEPRESCKPATVAWKGWNRQAIVLPSAVPCAQNWQAPVARPWRTGVATGYARCWNQHDIELQPADGAATSGGAHNYERKGMMLPTAIWDAGIGSVESCNRRRHMLQARDAGMLESSMWRAATAAPFCYYRQPRVLEQMRKDASTASQEAATGDEVCIHGEAREVQPAGGR